MECKLLKQAADNITMPEEIKRRIITNCSKQLTKTEESSMKNHSFFRKPAAILAALAVCLSLSVTAMAANGSLKGYFRDITKQNGAIIGTAYEQATDEIRLEVTVNSSELTALATFADPQKMPYREAETMGIADYRILDADGNAVKEGAAGSAAIVNGQAAIPISLDGITSGSYTLVVSAFVAEKKADQPLQISGSWECAFVK